MKSDLGIWQLLFYLIFKKPMKVLPHSKLNVSVWTLATLDFIGLDRLECSMEWVNCWVHCELLQRLWGISAHFHLTVFRSSYYIRRKPMTWIFATGLGWGSPIPSTWMLPAALVAAQGRGEAAGWQSKLHGFLTEGFHCVVSGQVVQARPRGFFCTWFTHNI